MNKEYIQKFIKSSIPRYDRIARGIAANESNVRNTFLSSVKAIEKTLGTRINDKLSREIAVLESGGKDKRQKKETMLGKVSNKIEKEEGDLKDLSEALEKVKANHKENSEKLNNLKNPLLHRERVLLEDARNYLKDNKKDFDKYQDYYDYMLEKVDEFKKFRKSFFKKHKDILKSTLGRKKGEFISEWEKKLTDTNKLKFLSKDSKIKSNQLAKLKQLKDATSVQHIEKLKKSVETSYDVYMRDKKEVVDAVKEFEKKEKEQKKVEAEEKKMMDDKKEYDELIEEYKEEIRETISSLRKLYREQKDINKMPIYKNNDLKKLKKVKDEFGIPTKQQKLYKNGAISAVIMNVVNNIATAAEVNDWTHRLDILNKIQTDLLDWDMKDMDFVKTADSPGNPIASMLAYIKQRAEFAAKDARKLIIRDIQRSKSTDEVNEEGDAFIEGIENRGFGNVDKIRDPNKADTVIDAISWQDVDTFLNKPSVKKDIINKSRKALKKGAEDGDTIAPYNFYSGWIPRLKVDSKWDKGKYRNDIGGRKMTESEINKEWDNLLQKIYHHVDKGLWEKQFRDSKYITIISKFMGDNSKSSRVRRVAGIIWSNVLLKVLDVLEEKINNLKNVTDSEEIENIFNVFGDKKSWEDVEKGYVQIEEALKDIKKVRKSTELYAEGSKLYANIVASDNITKEFLEPKEMILRLRKKYKKMKQADSNRDDIAKRVEHLFDETTEEEAPIGQYNNQVTYGPRKDTQKTNIANIINRRDNGIAYNVFIASLKKWR